VAENATFTAQLPHGDSGRAAARLAWAPSLTWRAAVGALIAVIWLVPIKSYRLPISLPFNLELYRLVIIVLLLGLVASVLIAGRELDAGGHGLPLILLAAAGVASLVSARHAIDAAGLQTQSVKSLSYLLSFVVAFILISSTVRAFHDIVAIVTVIVVGATFVAACAVVESRTHYNPFDHLSSWIPFLDHQRGAVEFARAGRLRVHASAQHPIALGVALTMCSPLAVYLASRARSRLMSWLWMGAGVVMIAGATVTVSRTVPLMIVGMVLTALWLRPRQVARRWPLLILVVAFVHFASPHTLGPLLRAFQPSGGLLAQQQQRSGFGGSGRIADITPGIELWKEQPLFGRGMGTNPTHGGVSGPQADTVSEDQPTIFDDQYMSSLVELGAVGFVAVVWLVVGAFVKIGRTAKRSTGPVGDLLAATAAACAGYALAMLTFDAFSFVQVTLLFFVIAALGLQARRLASAPRAGAADAGAAEPAVVS
jgi:O-Antigen ligase